ncbi:ABC transporter permease [Pseudactinotalea sp. Z1739]|uniref:ABC transporter permease n=1 Tax=Pseudactinotalea sp. Z1739 TaxID=3413028 RepID=UPI003C7BF927
MNLYADETDGTGIPRLDIGEWIESGFRWIQDNLSVVFDGIQSVISWATTNLAGLLNTPDALLLAVLFSAVAWLLRDWKLALLSLGMWLFVISVEQWQGAMLTLAMVIIATLVALLLAIPIGIAAAKSDRVSQIVRPVMDLMQTMPAFVWLVPVITLFSVGVVPGVIATVIFALPPGVRLTELGIRQVDAEVVEAGQAFGSTGSQILARIQLPLAMPTIMAGVNQVIMLALSMAVIAGLVGAGGLGAEVTRAISTIDIGLGFEAGLSVVVLAIYLDRVTAAVGGRKPGTPRAARLKKLLRAGRVSTIGPVGTAITSPQLHESETRADNGSR